MTSWLDGARCRGDERFLTLSPAAARRVCRRCPVRGECLVDALTWEHGQLVADDAIVAPAGTVAGIAAETRARLLAEHPNLADAILAASHLIDPPDVDVDDRA